MIDKSIRISVTIGEVEHQLTYSEWRYLIIRGNAEWQKLRTKCATCRCKVLPGETCGCCVGRKGEPDEDHEPEPFL